MRSLDALTHELRVLNGQLRQLDRQRQEILRRIEALHMETGRVHAEVTALKLAAGLGGHQSKPLGEL